MVDIIDGIIYNYMEQFIHDMRDTHYIIFCDTHYIIFCYSIIQLIVF